MLVYHLRSDILQHNGISGEVNRRGSQGDVRTFYTARYATVAPPGACPQGNGHKLTLTPDGYFLTKIHNPYWEVYRYDPTLIKVPYRPGCVKTPVSRNSVSQESYRML